VLRVAAHQLTPKLRVVPLPKAGEVLCDLHRTPVRGQQVDRQGHAACAEGTTRSHAEEILQCGCDPGRLILFVVHRDFSAAWQRDVFGRFAQQQIPLLGSQVREQGSEQRGSF